MNKMGTMGERQFNTKKPIDFIRNSYLYKLLKRFLSLISTLLLIVLLTLGGAMFYFNTQSRAASQRGEQYIAPFGLYTIISGSMEPNISVYDVVASVQVDDLSKIKVGDVITFISTWDMNYGMTVTHRIVAIKKGDNGDYAFTTKGDANEAIDGTYVTRENLIGKVMFKIPQLGRVQFFLATKVGWFVAVFVPALAVIIWDVIKIFKLRFLKNDIITIKTKDEADKTYFEKENLESRDIEDADLQKTTIISTEGIKKATSKKATTQNRKPLVKRNTSEIRKPIKTRKKLK